MFQQCHIMHTFFSMINKCLSCCTTVFIVRPANGIFFVKRKIFFSGSAPAKYRRTLRDLCLPTDILRCVKLINRYISLVPHEDQKIQ